MDSLHKSLMLDLFGYDIYQGATSERCDGWKGSQYKTPELLKIVRDTQPKIVIEVGSWMGRSAISMAKAGAELVICVDTWLGSIEHYAKKQGGYWGRDQLATVNGYPSFYERFLSNVVDNGLQDRILPIPNTSHIAGRWLEKQGIKADMIYIDASHDAVSVARDIRQYKALLKDGGVMVGDDYEQKGIRAGIKAAGIIAKQASENGKMWRMV